MREPPPQRPPPPPQAIVLEGPPIRQGVFTQEQAEATARLLLEAEELLSGGQVDEALYRAVQVEENYSESPGSSLALWVSAQAQRALENWIEAEESAEAYADLISAESAAYGRAYLLRAEVRRAGNLAGGIEAVFELSLIHI